MQRQGGGGNDPSCGCDMRVGWPSSADTKMQRGGGCGCTAGLFKGGKRTRKNRQSGGGCGCTGGVLPQMGGKRNKKSRTGKNKSKSRKSRYGKKSRSRK